MEESRMLAKVGCGSMLVKVGSGDGVCLVIYLFWVTEILKEYN